ncbi:TPA: helix-turn-helix domain-containing protein [Escherichia coli]|uniref:helix-turn-helix domain-containing protein n=1 Tax=Escherichia coli TaxID=562 RepID=UPI00164F1759|nr:helix-turn-helix domain-containing protein [Escherichia coli]MCC4691307.1 helix-turn-helix domain-containing protein [Escherichia coli]MCF7245323.1 helix-turn-helix domain-containing protein [Escherichia coli]MCX2053372.1 helix-turn-helix domain-containing protein [Escherichia coli]MEC9816016.1 helix-turn-helix domain-containing protein [Escherichia coli]MED9156488.1 helix-turn-helix domain-containing protein [Escherichia coli]
MSGVCYFILIKKPINVQLPKEFMMLNYGDILLLKHSEREFLQAYSDKYIEFELSNNITKNYLSRHNHHKKQIIITPPRILKKTFAYPDLLITIIDNLNIQNHIHPDFKDAISFSLLSIFSDITSLITFLTSDMPAFSCKVRSILLSDVSKHWRLRDLADYLYMNEGLIKKKLRLENTSFSQILLDTRMSLAINLLKQNHPTKHVSKMCGFKSKSYFVYLFKKYYKCTPSEYTKH